MAVGTTNVSMSEIANAFKDADHARDRLSTSTPYSFSDYRGIRLNDSSFIPSSGAVSIDDFRGHSPYVPWSNQAKYDDGEANYDQLGKSVSISGDGKTGVAGTVNHDGAKGAIYVYDFTDWVAPTKLQASDKQSNDEFGYSVAISNDGNTIAVGAPFSDYYSYNNAGAVYIFTKSNGSWSQQDKLVTSDAYTNSFFGMSVAISHNGNLVVAGAPGDLTYAGAAYVFTRSGSTWSQEQKLMIGGTVAQVGYDEAGSSVSVSGDGLHIMVGAKYEDTNGTNAGSIYYWTRPSSGANATMRQRFQHSDASQYDNAGKLNSIEISGDGNTFVMGVESERAPDQNTVNSRGAAYLFTRSGNTWTQRKRFLAYDGASWDYFGCSVSISNAGDRVIVGAQGEDGSSVWNSGSVYMYIRGSNNWQIAFVYTPSFRASDAAQNDYLGGDISLSGDGYRFLVGANSTDHSNGTDRGSVYTFE